MSIREQQQDDTNCLLHSLCVAQRPLWWGTALRRLILISKILLPTYFNLECTGWFSLLYIPRHEAEPGWCCSDPPPWVQACVWVRNARHAWIRDLRCVFMPQAAAEPSTSPRSHRGSIFIAPSLHTYRHSSLFCLNLSHTHTHSLTGSWASPLGDSLAVRRVGGKAIGKQRGSLRYHLFLSSGRRYLLLLLLLHRGGSLPFVLQSPPSFTHLTCGQRSRFTHPAGWENPSQIHNQPRCFNQFLFERQ